MHSNLPDGKPVWDRQRCELRLGTVVVKAFCRPAANQELVLAAFDELIWPARIDNPLPRGDDVDPVDRLHETVKRLNKQKNRLIRFRRDGLGKGVMWEPIAPGSPLAKF